MTRGVGGHPPANITHHFKGINFPARRKDLEEHARKNGADEDILDLIWQIPDQEYGNIADVMKGVGKVE